MSEIIRNSLFCRCCCRLGQNFRKWWHCGIIGRAVDGLRKAWKFSGSYRNWLSFGAAKPAVESSRYSRIMDRLRGFCLKLGNILRQSVFYKLLSAVSRGWQWLAARSRILGIINKLSLHQWLLVAFAFYLPIEYIIRDTLSIPVLSSIWEELFIIAAAILIIWRRALDQTRAIRRETPLDAWLILFFAVGFLLMSLVRPYPSVAVPGYRIVVEYMLWFFLIVRLVEDDRDMKVFLVSLGIMSSLLALHGIYQYAVGVEIPSSWVSHSEMGVRTRVFSLTGSPNILGSLMVLTAPVVAALVYYLKRPLYKFLAFCLLGCYLLTLLFTFSRGAWVGLLVAVLIFAWLVDKRLLAVGGAAVAGVLVAAPSITSRLTFLFTEDYAMLSSTGGRAMRWQFGLDLLHESNPWLGFGLGRFGGAVAMENQILDETEEFSYFYMDNYYLKTLVEMGYLGLIFYVLLIAALLILGIKAVQRSGNELAAVPGDPLVRGEGNMRLIAIGIYAGLCGVLVHCFFENIFEEPYMTAYFWGLAALLMYLGFFRKGKKQSSQ